MNLFHKASLALAASLVAAACAAQDPAASITATRQSDRITWTAKAPHGAAKLRLVRPDGTVTDQVFPRPPSCWSPSGPACPTGTISTS